MWRVLRVAALVGVVWAVWGPFTRWHRHWGATPAEFWGDMEGDEFVRRPTASATRAITVNARPEHIWPWLAQMGYRRGGLYSWDFLDIAFRILDRKSAKEVLPEFQDIKAGDEVPVGVGPAFPVLLVEPGRVLVLGSGDASFPTSWQTVLVPIDEGHTRIVTRNRVRPPAGWRGRLLVLAIDVPSFIMVKRWLEVLKERGEGLASGKYR